MEILLTRHGQTDWNVLKKVQGKADIELNKKGIEQAEATRDTLKNEKIDLILCSPLKRAKQTADIINQERNIPIIIDERVSERDFGEFEGMPNTDFDFNAFISGSLFCDRLYFMDIFELCFCISRAGVFAVN